MREDAVAGWGVGDGVADDLADFEGAGLLEEEHREAMGRLCGFRRCWGEDHCCPELVGAGEGWAWWFGAEDAAFEGILNGNLVRCMERYIENRL